MSLSRPRSVCLAALLAAAAPSQAVVDVATGRAYAISAGSYDLAGARALAASLGGTLASFADADEQRFVFGAFFSTFTSAGQGFWIGLADDAAEGVFLWDDGTSPTFGSWDSGQPDNCCGGPGPGEDGVELFSAAGAPRWNDHDAFASKRAILEFPVQVDPATGRAYVVVSTPLDLAGARITALEAGGTLVSFGDAAEEAFVTGAFGYALAGGTHWIGLGDEAVEGTFAWDDGTPFVYSAWDVGQPDDFGGAEDGVAMYYAASFVWNDAPVGNLYGAVVEIVPLPAPQTPPGDLCDVAIPIGDGVHPFDATLHYNDGPAATCANAPYDVYDVWFEYVAASEGHLIASLCPSSSNAVGGFATPNDTYLAIWTGPDCGTLAEAACSDGAPNCDVNESEARLYVLQGDRVWIQVGAWGGGQPVVGALAVGLEPPQPPNDQCGAPTPILPGVNPGAPAGASGACFRNFGATNSAEAAGCGTFDADVWFSFTSVLGGWTSISTRTPYGFVPATVAGLSVAVYDFCSNNELACAQPGFGADYATATFAATAGVTYVVRVGGNGDFGSFYVTVKEGLQLTLSSPAGQGSLAIDVSGGDPGALYFTCVTLAPGAYPYGWFLGLDPAFTDVFLQMASFAPPFVGFLDANGASTFALYGAPPLTLYAVTAAFGPGAVFQDASRPTHWTIP